MSFCWTNLRRGRRSGAIPAVAIACLVLVALLAVVQATHFHQNPNDADHCVLCVAMHSVVPVAHAAAIIVLVQLGIFAPMARAREIARYWHPQLFIRPPPAGC